MLEVPHLTADTKCSHPATQVTWIARIILTGKYSLATMLCVNVSPASGLNAQREASSEPVTCGHYLDPGKGKRQPVQ